MQQLDLKPVIAERLTRQMRQVDGRLPVERRRPGGTQEAAQGASGIERAEELP
ncbi:MAG: hypothetical protein HZY79_11005 [Rhodoblastus sp.]|nr:MAG: hypothetical protein HZY79_11005 [Rhodoblastus sp.]